MNFFISYPVTSGDRLATELKASLREAGHSFFEPVPGADWRAGISAAIRRSDAFIALLTTPSHGVFFELGLATGAHVPTLVVSSSAEGMPADLTSVPYVQLTGDTAHDVAAIMRRASEVAEGTPQTPATLPQTAKGVLSELARDPSLLERLSPMEFEELVARVFREQGFKVTSKVQTKDMGFDLVLDSDPMTVVECKRYSRQNLVSVGTVRQLVGTLAGTGAERAILVSTSGFTNAARALAAEAPVELVTVEDLLSITADSSEASAEIPDEA